LCAGHQVGAVPLADEGVVCARLPPPGLCAALAWFGGGAGGARGTVFLVDLGGFVVEDGADPDDEEDSDDDPVGEVDVDGTEEVPGLAGEAGLVAEQPEELDGADTKATKIDRLVVVML